VTYDLRLAIEQTLERIGRTPLAYQSLHREIVVFAVLHGRRNPAAVFRRFPD
jgi:hypothetical protein